MRHYTCIQNIWGCLQQEERQTSDWESIFGSLNLKGALITSFLILIFFITYLAAPRLGSTLIRHNLHSWECIQSVSPWDKGTSDYHIPPGISQLLQSVLFLLQSSFIQFLVDPPRFSSPSCPGFAYCSCGVLHLVSLLPCVSTSSGFTEFCRNII